jgi:rhodanese-related sulfurtransferase
VKTFEELIDAALEHAEEVFPWNLVEKLAKDAGNVLLVDIREPYEYDAMHIQGVLNVPRGILETACEYG